MQTTETQYLDTAEVAKLIRRRLAQVFPGQKISVRLSRFSGGSSISVQWTDGPRTPDVEAEVQPFEGKGFDGMIDLAYGKETWLLPDGSAQRAATWGTEASRGSVPDYVTDAPHPDALLVRSTCWVSCSRSITDENGQTAEALAFIRARCQTDGAGQMERFGGQYVTDLARSMALDRGPGESWEEPFRRIVMRES